MTATNPIHTAGASKRRKAWLGSGSALAAAVVIAAMAPGDAFAQSVSVAPRVDNNVAAQGDVTVAQGTVTITRGATKDQIAVDSSDAILNWTTFDTNTLATTDSYVNFLPEGTELEFVGPGEDYTVLNRIFPTADASGNYRGIAFGGTVTSLLGPSAPTGGNIWFYSPGGILVGPNATFNVGGLLLSTSDIAEIPGFGSPIKFTGTSQSDSSIAIDAGATILSSSYVGIVAPRVVQAGTVDADGSIAYVAAEQATLTINNGLFDIAVEVGSSDANGVVHTGTSTGDASQAVTDVNGGILDADARAIYMVAVPKNDAITMLVGGDIGYRPAVAAALTENGQIVLSAGANVSNEGLVNAPAIAFDTANAVAGGSIEVGGANFNSSTKVYASDTLSIQPGAGESVVFGSDARNPYDLDIVRAGNINLSAAQGGVFSVAGDLVLRAGVSDAVGGDIQILAEGAPEGSLLEAGVIKIGGDLTLDTSALGLDVPGPEADATAGSVSVEIGANASLTVGGNLQIDTSAQGGVFGAGTAGAVSFVVSDGIFNAGDLRISSDGIGGGAGGFEGAGLFAVALVAETTPAASGGTGIGGDITFDFSSGTVSLTSLTVSANGIGADGAFGDSFFGTSGGQGGDGIGGSATFNASGGTLSVSGTLAVTADGIAGSGGSGFGSMGGDGGNGTGGSAAFNLDGTATIDAAAILVSANGTGGLGGTSFDNSLLPDAGGGAGGDGQGGSATYNEIAGTIEFGSLTVQAAGTGGAGGDSLGAGPGQAQGAGGAGGAGTGGMAQAILMLDDAIGSDYVIDATGTGGQGGSGDAPGAGGSATGGNAGLVLDDALVDANFIAILATADGGLAGASDGPSGAAAPGGSAIGGTASFLMSGPNAGFAVPPPLTVDGSASGGVGSAGRAGSAVLAGGDGGTGGSAQGGSAEIILSNGAVQTFAAFATDVFADGFGGSGGVGGDNFLGGIAGDGGTGGAAIGGTVLIEAGSGTEITLLDGGESFSLEANGFGGGGGFGGSLDMTNGGTAGNGGDGGAGTGGAPILRSVGGNIIATGIFVGGGGFGGFAGLGGSDGLTILGQTGNGGDGVGGSPSLQALEGSPGRLTLGDVAIDASGIAGFGTVMGSTAGGTITLVDASTDPAGLITMASLFVTAPGSIAPLATPSLTIESNSGPITVTGNVQADVVGDIALIFDADGQLVVGGSTTLDAGGAITVIHTNNGAATISLDSAGNILANAGTDIDAQPGSILSGNEVFLGAVSDISVDDVRAIPNLVIQAGGDVFVRDAVAVGPQGAANFAGIFIDAGYSNPSGLPIYDPSALAQITGTVASYDDITINSGGNAVFVSGSSVLADNRLSVHTGDDIIVHAGALLSSGLNPTIPFDPTEPFASGTPLVLSAGGLVGSLSGPLLTPISSLVIDGTLSSGISATLLLGNAIDGSGSTITAGWLAADVNDAPIAGAVQGDDAGLLTAPCLEGNICLGNLAITNRAEIGLVSNNDVIALYLPQGAVSADEIVILTRNDIVMGGGGIATSIDTTSLFDVTSLTGNVDLGTATISSGQILIGASSGSLLGSATLAATGDIGITVGQDIFASAITAGGQLTTVAGAGGALEPSYAVPGSFTVDSVSIGAGDLNIVAGGDILIGTAAVPGTDIVLTAGGDASLGFTDTAHVVDILANNILFGDLTASSDVLLQALTGSVTGTAPGDIDSGGAINITAATDILANNLTAAVDAGLFAGGDIAVTTLDTGLGVASNAGGSFTAVNVLADPTLASFVSIDAVNGIDIGTLRTLDASLSSTGGPVAVTNDAQVAGILSAGGTSVSIVSSGDLAFDAQASAGDVTVTGNSSLSVLGAGATGTIDLSAAQDLALLDDVIAGSALLLDAGGLLSAGALASGQTIGILAGDLDIGALAALGQSDVTQAISITGLGDVTLGGAGGTGGFELDSAEFARIFSGGDITVNAGSLSGSLITVDDMFAVVGTGSGGAMDGNIGPAGSLILSSGGDILVRGNLAIFNASLSNHLVLDAPGLIRLVADTGALQMLDATEGLTGVIDIFATDFIAATDAAFADIQGMSLSQIDLRLGDSDGMDNPFGVIRADTLNIDTTASRVFIQNTSLSSAIADRRGFEVNTLNIGDSGGTIQPIVINGTIGGTTGLDTIGAVSITSSFDPFSTINGCLIVSPAVCIAITPGENPFDDPTRDLVRKKFNPNGDKDSERDPDGDRDNDLGSFDTMLVELKPVDGFEQDPLIDQPVTGAGNEDLWVDPDACQPNDSSEECQLEPAE
ncbi:hypothetical protein [Altererythrobacter sp.]|uniref:hypothetical protein n=1 Tax=Altererythrobacter sp. TaxID=1872480 RepID=UPI003CFFFE6C